MEQETAIGMNLLGVEQSFEEQARRTPEALAIVADDRSVTYRELSLRSNQLARYLKRIGVRQESLVGLYVERSAEMVVGMLGILKAGGAYVPLDPQYPRERLEYIAEDSGLKAVLTQEKLLASFPPNVDVHAVCLDRDWHQVAAESGDDPEVPTDDDNLAYVIYTSGSTGRPKGVGIRRGSVAVFSRWARGVFGDDLAGVLASTSICFDLSVFEILVPLGAGGTVFVVDNALSLPALGNTEGLRLINTVPSVLSELLRQHSLPASVRTVNLAGEALRRNLVDRVYEQESVRRLLNLYGPSEDTTYSTYACLDRAAEDGVVPIGKAIAGTETYVLDEEMREVAPGESGELCLGGEGLARGYINQPALTAASFVPNPFSSQPGARMYRTGDRVRLLPDGGLEFLGRLDEQVKLRGFRIELGEIETVLNQHPEVRESAVIVREDSSDTKHLVAYLTARSSHVPDAAELRSYLSQKLPEYMLPARFVLLEEFPRTQTGKLARRNLPAPELPAPDLTPQTETERALAAACSGVLGLSQIPLGSSFLELGGNSLNATRLVAALQKTFACDLPLRVLLDGTSLREAAAEFDRFRVSPPAPPAVFGNAARDGRPLPASYSQERVWFIQRVDPSSVAYSFTAQITLHGELDVATLEKALNRIVERHEIFRTTLTEIEGCLYQIIHEPWKVELDCLDMRGERDAAQASLQRQAREPFNLATLPLVRWSVVRLEDEKYLFQSVEHHMVHDGWSYNVFLKELTEFYRAFTEGGLPQVHPAPLQFADFTQWQREWMETPQARQQLQYWTETLAGAPPLLSLPYDHPRPQIQTYKGANPRIEISEELYAELFAAARRERVTVFMLCAAAFQILLYRYSGQEEFCLGTGIANRRWQESGDLIGMLVNNVALRVHTDPRSTIGDVVKSMRETALAAYANQDLPFDKVVEAARPVRDLSYNPLFQVMFSFHDSPVSCAELSNVSMQIEQALSNGSAKFDMNIVVVPPQSHNLPPGYRPRAQMLWEYNTDLFDAETIQRMVTHYLRILEMVLRSPRTRVREIALLTEAESRRVVLDWNAKSLPYPHEQLPGDRDVVHRLFAEQAERRPEAVALIYEGEQVTYGELNRRANRLGHYLRSLNPGAGMRVGVCLGRSPEAAVAMLAVLKAGHAYVPLDPAFPPERLQFMLSDAGVGSVVTERRYASHLPEAGRPILLLDELAEALEAQPDSDLESETTRDSPAYVMYTSGSTGEPKGAVVPHRAIIRLLFGVDYVRLGSDETLLQLAPLGFDASTFELWGALLHGGRLVIYPETDLNLERLGEIIRKNGVSCMWLTASLFNFIVDSAPQTLRGVRQVLTGGEALSVPHVDKALELLPETTITNGYGPTECTTFTCCFNVPRPRPAEWRSIPIGHPVGNTRIYILDAYGSPVPHGLSGELCVGGAGVALGYLNRPELTAEKFVPDPFEESGGRLYRTGDLVRWRPEGVVEFLGRRDSQVKIRGHRIELGEIERTLLGHDAVREAVVVAREDAPGEKHLVGYIVADAGRRLDADELRTFVRHKLPEYMVPVSFVTLEKLPLRESGKVDTGALPAPDYATKEATYVEPRTPTEKRLASIWAAMLPTQRIGVESHFFRSGGHSLKVIQMIARVRDAFGVELAVRDIFENPTLGAVALAVDAAAARQQNTARRPPVVAHPRGGALPLSYNEEILWTAAQARPHYLAFNTQVGARFTGRFDVNALQLSLSEIRGRHEALRTTFKVCEGRPYRSIEPHVSLHIPIVDLSHLTEDEREREARELALVDARAPFDLTEGPLWRVKLLRLSADQHILLLTAHHIITDGWSLSLLTRELRALYEAYSQGRPHSLPPLAIQYADYAAWQRSWLNGMAFKQLIGYWVQRLGGVKGLRRLPPDLPESADEEIRQDVASFTLDGRVYDGLRRLSDREGVTVFMTLLAVYNLLLSLSTGAEDVAVAVPVSERTHLEFEPIMGLFVNMVPLHTDFHGDPTFVDLLRQVRLTCQDAYAHQDAPFVIVEQALGHAELSRTMFDFINVPDFDIELPGLKAEPFSAKGINPFKMDLIMFVRDRGGAIHFNVMYNAGLFSRSRIADLIEQFERLVEQVLESPEKRVSECSLPGRAPGQEVST